MRAFEFDHHLIDAYARFSRSFASIKAEDLRAEVDRQYEDGRFYQLSASLPDAPLALFKAKVKTLPQTTEAERLVVQRIGQEIFRASLLEYWQGRCPLTGISDTALLRASHIIPWKDCASDEERLDVHNGLLLSALWDAAFDRGLVTFGDDGCPIYAPELSEAARGQLQWLVPLNLTERHRERLAFHRASVFRSCKQ